MVTGHLSFAFLAKARWPRAASVALLVATMLPDLADFVLPQGNQCRTSCELYTHAVPSVLVLAALMSALTWQIWHRRITALLAGGLVVLHVACDFFTGFKPFWLGGPPTGLGLYRYQGGDFAVEALMVIIAFGVLRRSNAPPRWAVHPLTLMALILIQASFDAWSYRAGGGAVSRLVAREGRPFACTVRTDGHVGGRFDDTARALLPVPCRESRHRRYEGAHHHPGARCNERSALIRNLRRIF